MGEMKVIIPQGPNRHCGKASEHERHSNVVPVNGEFVLPREGRVVADGTWCDGVPQLEPFYELMVRVPMRAFGMEPLTHLQSLEILADMGLGCLIDEIGESATTTLRVRGRDGVDKVYPLTSVVINPEKLGQGRLW